MKMDYAIELGAFCAPLAEQIPGLVDVEWCQKKADAISLLTIHGLITHAESDRARRRLIKTFRIDKSLEQGSRMATAAGEKP